MAYYNENNEVIEKSSINISTRFKEHCDFKNAPCNYHGYGWYDRCAWCKDNNGFKRINNADEKPF